MPRWTSPPGRWPHCRVKRCRSRAITISATSRRARTRTSSSTRHASPAGTMPSGPTAGASASTAGPCSASTPSSSAPASPARPSRTTGSTPCSPMPRATASRSSCTSRSSSRARTRRCRAPPRSARRRAASWCSASAAPISGWSSAAICTTTTTAPLMDFAISACFAGERGLEGDAHCGFAVLDFGGDHVGVEITRPEGLVSHNLAAIKQGRALPLPTRNAGLPAGARRLRLDRRPERCGDALEHFRAKWAPVRVKKTRRTKVLYGAPTARPPTRRPGAGRSAMTSRR